MGSKNGRLKIVRNKSKILLILGIHKIYNIIIGYFKHLQFQHIFLKFKCSEINISVSCKVTKNVNYPEY